jgi:hypothetical protein
MWEPQFARALRWAIPVTLAGLLSLPPVVRADDASRIDELEKKLDRSLKVIEELSKEVQELKAKQQAAPAAPAAAAPAGSADQAAQIQELKQQVDQLTTSFAAPPTADLGLPLHGFADVGWHTNNTGDHGFDIASMDFYLTPQFGDRVKALAELIFEVGESGNPPVVAPDLERLQIGYIFNDDFTLWAGRFHTPYGYWNTAFHHGKQLMTTIDRPHFIDFEDSGGILPAHSVGLWGNGGLRAGDGKINYDLYIANGQRIVGASGTQNDATGQLDMNLLRDDNHSYEYGAKVGYQFGGRLEGLQLGTHYLDEKVNDDVDQPNNLPSDKTDVHIYGGYGVYITDDWEILSEYYRFNDHDQSGSTGTHNSWATYAQIGHPFGSFTPYFRFERTRLDQNDNYFAYQEAGFSYRRSVFGLRYDINPKVALKFEFQNTRNLDRDVFTSNELKAQLAVRF